MGRGEGRDAAGKEFEERQEKLERSTEVRTEPRKGRRQRKTPGPPPNKPLINSLAAEGVAAKFEYEKKLDRENEAQEPQMSQVHEFIAIWYALVSPTFVVSSFSLYQWIGGVVFFLVHFRSRPLIQK